MKIRNYILLFVCPINAFSQSYTAKTLVDNLILPEEIGKDWRAVNPEKWPTGTNSHIVAMYELKDPDGKNDSVIADIFIFQSPEQAGAMLEMRRKQIAAGAGMILEELPEVGKGAFASIHESEKQLGRRTTFCCRNAVITLSPSKHSIDISKLFSEKLK
jgi:hypothetical protein